MSTQLLGEEFLTEEEAGEILGTKVNTLRIQSARRQGPPRVKVGRRVYYRKKSLLEWMLERERFHASPSASSTSRSSG